MLTKLVKSDARAREKPCLRCGYSLRQNFDARHCPECGLSVWLSLNPNDALTASNPEWLTSSVRGAWIVAAGQVLSIGAFAMVAMVWFSTWVTTFRIMSGLYDPEMAGPTTMPGTWVTSVPTTPSHTLSAGGWMGAAYLVINAIGLLMLTTEEGRYPDRTRWTRIMARIIAPISLLAAAGLAMYMLRHTPGGLNPWEPANGLWQFGIELIYVASAICMLGWFRRMTYRAGKSALSRLCGYLLFLPVIPLFKFAPFVGLWALHMAAGFADFVPFAYLPASLVLCVWCARILSAAVPQARAHWAAETRSADANLSAEIPSRAAK